MPRLQIEHKRRAPLAFKYSDVLEKKKREEGRELDENGKEKEREKNDGEMNVEGKEERREDEEEGNLGSTCSF